MQLRTYLKKFGNLSYYQKYKINKINYAVYAEYLDNDNDKYILNFYISKDMNNVLNRYRGFNLSASNNNNFCLYSLNIDYFLHYENGKFTNLDNIKFI